jgi:hypothetical protein
MAPATDSQLTVLFWLPEAAPEIAALATEGTLSPYGVTATTL